MSKITTVLFDLDGTLLPMDQEEFVGTYLRYLGQTMAPLGYDPRALARVVWGGVAAMVANHGPRTNEEVFWDVFAQELGPEQLAHKPEFERFYATEFQKVQSVCGVEPEAARTVALAKELGFGVALATNPVFPRVATQSRVRWAGLEPEQFQLVTCYEDSCSCKPDPAYFAEVAARLGVAPEECLMVGNDLGEDTPAAQLGMQVFVLTDCLIAPEGSDLEAWPHGSWPELQALLRRLAG